MIRLGEPFAFERTRKEIRLPYDLLNDTRFSQLSDARKAHLLCLLLLAARMDNFLPNHRLKLERLIGATEILDLSELAEFIAVAELERPSYEDRIKSFEKLEKALLARKNAIAEAISRDFGNRSKHESMVSEVFLVVGAIKHAKAHLRDWMEPEEREVGWVFLPAGVELRPQPVGVVGII